MKPYSAEAQLIAHNQFVSNYLGVRADAPVTRMVGVMFDTGQRWLFSYQDKAGRFIILDFGDVQPAVGYQADSQEAML